MQTVYYTNLGLIDYQIAWNLQQEKFDDLVRQKLNNRDLPQGLKHQSKHRLFFCEHPPVFTLGKNANEQNLLATAQILAENGIKVYHINRGGDITHHGPGQLVGYPILDLDYFFTDIDRYLRLLEEVIIQTLAEYQIFAGRMKGATGVWLNPENPLKARKICAMGIRCSRWVTMHGFAMNVNNDLDLFDLIIPCGLKGKQVTSVEKELGRKVDFKELENKLLSHFSRIFEVEILEGEPNQL